MKKHFFKKTFLTSLSIAVVLVISGCSDDKATADNKMQTNGVENQVPISHTLLASTVSASDKQKFEQAFAAQCVERETKNSVNPDNDKARASRDCECVAMFMMKDLTAIEAEKFLTEHQNSQSLTIKYENAAYHCLQQKTPKPAHLFSKP